MHAAAGLAASKGEPFDPQRQFCPPEAGYPPEGLTTDRFAARVARQPWRDARSPPRTDPSAASLSGHLEARHRAAADTFSDGISH